MAGFQEKENECVIDADYLDGKNLKIGDKITLSSGDFGFFGRYTQDRYIYHCWYGQQSGVYCISQRQYNNRKWKCQCLSLRSGESFSLDVYTEITVQVEGAKEATAFTKEYEEHVDSVLKKVQAIKAEREQARYDEITSTAQEKVDEAQEELAQAEQDLADGKEEAEEELASAREKLDAAQKELERGKNQLAASKLELEQSRNLLVSKQKELNQSKQKLSREHRNLAKNRLHLQH